MAIINDPLNKSKRVNAMLAADTAQDKMHSNQKIAERLLKESTNYSSDSDAKMQEAQKYLQAAQALEQLAQVVRQRAEELRRGEIDQEKAATTVASAAQVLQMPIPKDATPELLEEMANNLEEKAKENRRTADDLIKQAQESRRLAKQLEEQAHIIAKKDMVLSDVDMKTAVAHNEELRLVFIKLGIIKLDSQYKEQVAYGERKANQDLARGG